MAEIVDRKSIWKFRSSKRHPEVLITSEDLDLAASHLRDDVTDDDEEIAAQRFQENDGTDVSDLADIKERDLSDVDGPH